MNNPCQSHSPYSGTRCEMAQGHFGKHRVGDETWVVPCTCPCVFHHNTDGKDSEWEECIHCGAERPVTEKEDWDKPMPNAVRRANRFCPFMGFGVMGFDMMITRNKSLEMQAGRFKPTHEYFNLSTSWTRMMDHAGLTFEACIFGLHLIVKFYDNRHWDHYNMKWREHE